MGTILNALVVCCMWRLLWSFCCVVCLYCLSKYLINFFKQYLSFVVLNICWCLVYYSLRMIAEREPFGHIHQGHSGGQCHCRRQHVQKQGMGVRQRGMGARWHTSLYRAPQWWRSALQVQLTQHTSIPIWNCCKKNHVVSLNNSHVSHPSNTSSWPGPPSRYDQLKHIMDTAADHCCKKMRFHILTDGRDVHENTSLGFVEQLEKDLLALQKWGCDARIASGGGRMFVTMDRNNVCTTRNLCLIRIHF